jgi:hypothetical protein
VRGYRSETIPQVTGVTSDGEGQDVNGRGLQGVVERLGQVISAGEAVRQAVGLPGRLVLPDEVMAGQLVARAWAGQPVALTGKDSLLPRLIGHVLQAGLATWERIDRCRKARSSGGTWPACGRGIRRGQVIARQIGPLLRGS